MLCHRKYEHCSKRRPCASCETARPAIPYTFKTLAQEIAAMRRQVPNYLRGNAYWQGHCLTSPAFPSPYAARNKRERLEELGYTESDE